MTKSEVQQLVADTAVAYGVPAPVALAIADHESRFDPAAVNRSNKNGTTDWGVMQLNDSTVATMGVADPLDPVQNVDAGVRLIRDLLGRYSGDLRLALWAYASGTGAVGDGKPQTPIAAAFIQYVLNYPGVSAGPGGDAGGDGGDGGAGPEGSDAGPYVLAGLGIVGGFLLLRVFLG